MKKKIISQEEYDQKLQVIQRLQEDLDKLEPSSDFEYGKDEWSTKDDDATLTIHSNYDSWNECKVNKKEDPCYLEILEVGESYSQAIALTVEQMKQLRNYLNHKIDYLEEN